MCYFVTSTGTLTRNTVTKVASLEGNANEQPFYGHMNPGELVLSQRRDLLEQPLDFYKPDVLPATQPTLSKHYGKTQWFGHLLIYRHGISTPCLTNSVKALKEHRR